MFAAEILLTIVLFSVTFARNANVTDLSQSLGSHPQRSPSLLKYILKIALDQEVAAERDAEMFLYSRPTKANATVKYSEKGNADVTITVKCEKENENERDYLSITCPTCKQNSLQLRPPISLNNSKNKLKIADHSLNTTNSNVNISNVELTDAGLKEVDAVGTDILPLPSLEDYNMNDEASPDPTEVTVDSKVDLKQGHGFETSSLPNEVESKKHEEIKEISGSLEAAENDDNGNDYIQEDNHGEIAAFIVQGTEGSKEDEKRNNDQYFQTTQSDIGSCSAYADNLTVEGLYIEAGKAGVTVYWYFISGEASDCVRGYFVRVCTIRGECVSDTLDANASRFSVAQNRSTYYNASVTPLIVNGNRGKERSTEYELMPLCPDEGPRVRNLTATTTSTTLTLSWALPDLSRKCLGNYYIDCYREDGHYDYRYLYDLEQLFVTLTDLIPDTVYRCKVQIQVKNFKYGKAVTVIAITNIDGQ